MKQLVTYLALALVFVLIGWFANTASHLSGNSVGPRETAKPTPLAKYTIESLSQTYINPSRIEIGKTLKDSGKYTSNEFSINFDPTLKNGSTKTVSGLINIPEGNGVYPAVILFRGYVDPAQYFTGNGTGRVGEYFVSNGFITIAPDFLGYGASSPESDNIFESRFQTYTTALELIKSVSSVKKWDGKNLFIWGHSNGGHIALTTLEITGGNFPTVLWAPVSKPFPYSILYYTDDASDGGKFLRRQTSEFEGMYDSNLYSLTNYLEKINAPLQLNQGTADEAVPLIWSNALNDKLKSLGKDITYITYPEGDHNMTPGWNEAVVNALNFYKKYLH